MCIGAPMAIDPRDELWATTFDTYYDAYYQELLAGALVQKWQRFDVLTKVLVALTASGSAVAGWALWSQPGLKTAWTTLAGVAAVLSILESTLSVAERVKQNLDSEHRFGGLRSALETLRYEMRINAEFPVQDFTDKLIALRKQLSDYGQLEVHDLLTTTRLRNSVQDELNVLLKNEIES